MRVRFSFVTLFAISFLAAKAHSDDAISFNRDIRPILSNACFQCHGPDENHREADLRLDDPEQAGETAFVGGHLEASEAWSRIVTDDPDLKMPPPDSGKKISNDEIKLLRKWILSGAEHEPYWAYAQPKSTSPPSIKQTDWPRDAIDHYILSPLEKEDWKPAPDAPLEMLLRRLSFDLTGLPPTIEQLDDYAADSSDTNWLKHIDRMLASPEFGERMAMYWLDLVRFADTVGYHGDQDHSISPYRDYVINSFNDNLPLNEFVREQLAGDLFPNPTIDQQVATGYNRLLQTSHEGGVQPKEYLAIYAADRIRNLSEVFMGATVGCAQCHDHKYDPYTTDDFYSLVAFFADVDEAQHFKTGSNSLPTRRDPEIKVLQRWQRDWMTDIDSKIKSLEQRDDQKATEELSSLRASREALQKSERRTMVTKATEPREIRLLPRGDWLDDSGPVMTPRVPKFLRPLNVDDRHATRLDLANWLVDHENGVGYLTARVFVNRLWYLMFGRGLSTSLADFGGQGVPPTHPELLDQLTLDFVASGWDTKSMIRRLALTRTYRQTSVTSPEKLNSDPYNARFARQSRFRLPAEMVRDQSLMVSDLLVRRVGGASVKPAQPAGYYRHLNFPKRQYKQDEDENQWRRGVYVHWQRQFLHPMLKAMDAPSREECTAQRPRSNTPLEALVLLNDPTMLDAASGLTSRIMLSSKNDKEGLRRLFRVVTSRQPTDWEMATMKKLLGKQRQYFHDHEDEAITLAKRGREDFQAAEFASWLTMSRTVLNLYEVVARY